MTLVLLLSPSLFGTLLGIIAVAGPFGHLLIPAAFGILAVGMAVVVSTPQEEETRTEPRKQTALVVVSMPRQSERHGGQDEAEHEAGRRTEERAATHRPRALIVGSGDVARTLRGNLERSGGYDVVGFVDDIGLSSPDLSGMPLLGSRSSALAVVREYGVDAVFIASQPSWQQQLAESMIAEHPDVSVNIVPSFQEAMMRLSCVRSCGDIALVSLTASADRVNEAVKRSFDLAASVIGLIITMPVLLFVGLLIKMTSPGPVIFYQQRVGRYGRPFMLYKFRTMVIDAEAKTGPVLADGKADSRLTPIGRWLRMFRVDELPQFWNVIRGDMSLVGPRPERPFFVEQFEARLPTYSRRHQVRPGVTGLAQVYGGYHTDPEDKLRFDLIYVSQQSLWLDLSILVRTVLVVCKPHR